MGLRTQKRRRRENKTDYKARRILLVSGCKRIVVRLTNKYFILQAVESSEAQDKVLATVTSKELLKSGWSEEKKGSLKSIPAGYLTGILMAKKLGNGKYIMDLGMARTGKGGRIFSAVAGLVEGGLDISANKKVFPSEDRLMGEHAGLKDITENCKNTILKVGGKRLAVSGNLITTKKTKEDKE